MTENTPDQTTKPRDVLTPSAFLLGFLAALTVFVAVDHSMGRPALPPPLQARLHAAAEAVLPTGVTDRSGSVHVGSEHGSFEIPVREQYDRQRAVELALELDSQRRRVEGLLSDALALNYAGAATAPDTDELARIAALAREARAKYADFLAVSPKQAAVILFGLDWPWLHHDLSSVESSALRPYALGLPVPLRDRSPDEMERLTRRVRRSPAWPAAKAALKGQYGLSEDEAEAVRAHVCRRGLEAAFGGPLEAASAREVIGKYANLTDAQLETVLAMRGVLDLTLSGTQAYPALIWLLERRPALAVPLLERCTEINRIERQATLAAARLGADDWQEARRELVALGPFGGAVLREALDSSGFQPGERARDVLQRIREVWPGEGRPLEVLGADVEAWRRWYASAKDVL